MSLPRYPEYKDSGVPWLGEVPAHWTLPKLKHFTRFTGGGTPNRDSSEFWNGEIPWVSPKDMKAARIDKSEECITEVGLTSSSTSLVPPGRVLLVVRSGILKHTIPVAINTVEVVLNQDMKALNFVRNYCESAFFLRWVQGLNDELLLAWAKQGATVESIEHAYLENTVVPLPPLVEQTAIAAFLDREAGKIDTLIAEQEKLIALLVEKCRATISHAVTRGLNRGASTKDSGVAWMGSVPAHWAMEPLANRYRVQLGKMLDSAKISGAHLRPYLRVFDVQWGQINVLDLPKMDFDEGAREKFRLALGDILVNEGGSYPGRSAIWKGEIDECYYQKALHRLRPACQDKDSSEFFYFVLFWAANQGIFVAGGNETTIEHLPAERLRRYRFAFPPLNEQREIAAFLHLEIEKLETLKLEAVRVIALLKERRGALISAAVTGQIDVRGAAAQPAASVEAMAA